MDDYWRSVALMDVLNDILTAYRDLRFQGISGACVKIEMVCYGLERASYDSSLQNSTTHAHCSMLVHLKIDRAVSKFEYPIEVAIHSVQFKLK